MPSQAVQVIQHVPTASTCHLHSTTSPHTVTSHDSTLHHVTSHDTTSWHALSYDPTPSEWSYPRLRGTGLREWQSQRLIHWDHRTCRLPVSTSTLRMAVPTFCANWHREPQVYIDPAELLPMDNYYTEIIGNLFSWKSLHALTMCTHIISFCVSTGDNSVGDCYTDMSMDK